MLNWKEYLLLLESIDSSLKSTTYKIREMILYKIDIGMNKISIDYDKSKINININYEPSDNYSINGYINILEAIQCEFKEFNMFINCSGGINYDELISVIQHELKHIYDVLYEDDIESFMKLPALNKLKKEYKNFDNLYEFIHLVYESLKHELEARNIQIYDRLRWLKIYDKSLLRNEYKKTYVYKTLIRLSNFNSDEFINKFESDELESFTKRFVELFGDELKTDVNLFYKNWEFYFKKVSKEYLNRAEDILDELIIDVKPYMESKLTTKHFPNRNEYKDLFLYQIK